MTQRSIADLQALLADNTSGNISPADMRDVVDSLQWMIGDFDLLTPAPTLLSGVAPETWMKIAGTTVFEAGGFRWSMPQSNRLQYDGIVQARGNGTAIATITGTNNHIVEIGVYINGALIPDTVTEHFIDSTRQRDSTITVGQGLVNPGDHYELWARNMTASADITATKLTFNAVCGTA